jgi:hypothetical protein
MWLSSRVWSNKSRFATTVGHDRHANLPCLRGRRSPFLGCHWLNTGKGDVALPDTSLNGVNSGRLLKGEDKHQRSVEQAGFNVSIN